MAITEASPAWVHAVDGELLITQLLEQSLKLIAAAMNVADDVKRAMLLAFVIPKRNPFNRRRLDLLGTSQHEHMPEAFSGEATERTAKLRVLLPNDVGTKVPFAPTLISILT